MSWPWQVGLWTFIKIPSGQNYWGGGTLQSLLDKNVQLLNLLYLDYLQSPNAPDTSDPTIYPNPVPTGIAK